MHMQKYSTLVNHESKFILVFMYLFFYSSLAAALARVMSVAGPIHALASVSVLQSAPVGGSVVGVVGPL